MKIRGLLLILALASAPAEVAAQGHREPGAAEHSRSGPVEMLLRDRTRLELSAAQVERLEAIERRMEERNRPLVTRLVQMRRDIHSEFHGRDRELEPAEREEYQRRVERAKPLLREIRENNRAAMREVGEVLTSEQKERLREMLRTLHERRRADEKGGRRRDHGG